MAIWKIQPSAPADNAESIHDFMAELDAELGAATPVAKQRSAPKAKLVAKQEPAPFIQMWFATRIESMVNWQECRCGEVHQSFAGLFLVEQHRNGALRKVRHDPLVAIPHEYATLEVGIQYVEEKVAACHECQAYFYAPAPAAKTEITRNATDYDLKREAKITKLREEVAGGALTEAEADAALLTWELENDK